MDPGHNLYVSDDFATAIFVFAAGAHGNVSPIRTIQGTSTQLNSPSGIVLTAHHTIVVANPPSNSLTSYPRDSNGNVAPTRTIQGGATGLNFPIGLSIR
jgi:6-phosphogluconolactonase (cycloisomerase 2 family)